MKSCDTHLSWDVAALTVASCAARIHYMLEQPGLISPVIAGVAISPYGMLPMAPEVGTPPIPENRVGIAARPMSGLGPPRQAAFVAARSLTPPLRCSPEAQPGAQSLAVIPRSLFPVSCLLTICSTQMPFEYLQRSLGQDSHT